MNPYCTVINFFNKSLGEVIAVELLDKKAIPKIGMTLSNHKNSLWRIVGIAYGKKSDALSFKIERFAGDEIINEKDSLFVEADN